MINNYLKAGINRTMDDTRSVDITRATIEGFGEGCWDEIMDALTSWSEQGLLTVIKDPRLASKDEVCVMMKSYIDRASPWPNWP